MIASPTSLQVRFLTRNCRLVDRLQTNYYLDVLGVIGDKSDAEHILHRPERDPNAALFIDASLFPEYEDEAGPNYTRVVVIGAVGREDRLPLTATVDAIASALGAEPRPRPGSRDHVVFSPGRGGTGKSTWSLETARCASFEEKVILVELDIRGSLRCFLDAPPQQEGVYELLRSPDFNSADLADFVYVKDELHALLGPAERRDDASRSLNPTNVLRLLEVLRRRYDRIFFDLPANMAFAGTLWPHCQSTIMVIDAEDPSLHWAKATTSLLEETGARDKCHVVVNFAHSPGEDAAKAELTVGLPVLGAVSGDLACREIQHQHRFIVDDKRSRVGEQIRNIWKEIKALPAALPVAA